MTFLVMLIVGVMIGTAMAHSEYLVGHATLEPFAVQGGIVYVVRVGSSVVDVVAMPACR